ncbi:MAG: tsaB [Candidatus Doudnabacteria bacterium]|nr:tsaB [Candidatus Doudnabacteria bacterium]
MILLIDSAGYNQIHFALINNLKTRARKIKITYPETEKTLGYLEKFLKTSKVKLNQIEKIIVVSGPGSFTGIRVGVTIGLAFSFAKNIPLYAVEKDRLPEDLSQLEKMKLKKVGADFDPAYGAEPNITIKKKTSIN